MKTAITTLLISGLLATQVMAAQPESAIEKRFNSSVKSEMIQSAVHKAAATTGWSVDAITPTKLQLTKVFESEINGMEAIGDTIESEVTISVDLSANDMRIARVQESDYVSAETISYDMKKLEEAIYLKLLPQLL